MKKKLLFISGLFFIFSTYYVFGQQPSTENLLWNDIDHSVKNEFVFIPPPASFTAGIRSSTFNITYTGFSTDAQAAFQYAADIWSSILISVVPIKVNAYVIPLPGTLGITFPNGRKDFPNAPLIKTWYATSLANAITGSELNSGEMDMDLFLSSLAPWYFGVDGNCPAGEYDFVTTVLHELCHGMGFVGLAKVQDGKGSFGLLQQSDFAPLVTSFPWPDLDTLPSAFDRYLLNVNGQILAEQNNPSGMLAGDFTSNKIYFGGAFATANNDGVFPRIYAPPVFALGSSMLHLDEATYPEGNKNELMTPFSGTAAAVHDPGPVVVGVLKDLGWKVNYVVGLDETHTSPASLEIFPNPASSFITCTSSLWKAQPATISILNMIGKEVWRKKIPSGNNIRQSIGTQLLSPGMYLLRVSNGKTILESKFIRQ